MEVTYCHRRASRLERALNCLLPATPPHDAVATRIDVVLCRMHAQFAPSSRYLGRVSTSPSSLIRLPPDARGNPLYAVLAGAVLFAADARPSTARRSSASPR